MWNGRHLTVEQVEGFVFLDLSSLMDALLTLHTVRPNFVSNENTIFAKSLWVQPN